MKIITNGAGFVAVLAVALGIAVPAGAQAPEPNLRAPDAAGSVIIFPKFQKGSVVVDGVMSAQTEIEVEARCPNGAACSAEEPVTVKFHWVCPGSEEAGAKYVCKETDFDVAIPINGKASFNAKDPQLAAKNPGSSPPCPSGYLIGWVINPATDRPIKFDALTGSAILRGGGSTQSYQALTIQADRNLAHRAEIATDIDPRTGTPSLVFDGGPGHYQALAAAVPANLDFHKLTGPLASGGAFLILLTLDVRVNRPNYPTFVDLEFLSVDGSRASTTKIFICWAEIQHPNIDANFTLAGARTGDAVVLSGKATKVPFGGISDVPGPHTLLGLAPGEEGALTMDPVYLVQRFDSSKPTTVFVPFGETGYAIK